jgi:hypothetical protein
MAPSDVPPARTWVVDVANVMGARPDGWWRDRAAAANRLRRRILALLAAPPPGIAPMFPVRIVLVLEGAARSAAPVGETASVPEAGPEPGPTLAVVHAAGSGDDSIVAATRSAEAPVLVVTSDRALRARIHALGATTVGARALWSLLDQSGS